MAFRMSTIDDPTCGGGHHFALGGGGSRGDHGGDEEYDSDYGDDDFDDEPGERSIDFHLVISSGFSIGRPSSHPFFRPSFCPCFFLPIFGAKRIVL